MAAAGLIHFGGHGDPGGITEGLTARALSQLQLSPSVIFSGACYTGVTGRWFEPRNLLTEVQVAPEESFCLAVLQNQVLGYLAALHPDHGMPVYQEIEFLASAGASLGEIIKHTQDGVIMGAGGHLPVLPLLSDGSKPPKWSYSEIMLCGTASRVLFGDPALIIAPPFLKPPFEITVTSDGVDKLRVTAVLVNQELTATFTDTYHSDLAADSNQFNARALLQLPLPAEWTAVRDITELLVKTKTNKLKARMVGQAVEQDFGATWLHLQVDLPSTGFMQSPFRTNGAEIGFSVER